MAGPHRAADSARPFSSTFEFEFLDSKLRPPQSRPGLVKRPALVDRLEHTETPVISVVAPAGYGKTTLLAEWLAQTPLATSWVSLDTHDNDVGALVAYLAEVLGRIEPIAPRVLRALVAPSAVDAGAVARRLAVVVAAMRTPFVMVLDHAEMLESQRCGDVISEVALSLPPGSRFAVASRSEPPIPLSQLRARGHLLELTAHDLAMTEPEARALIKQAEAEADEEQFSELMRRTEGWPVGLYLGALAMKAGRHAPIGRPPFRPEDLFVSDYVGSEVLSSLSPEATLLLTRTSILERLSGPVCDAVAGTTGSHELLESLAASNMLVVRLDGQRRWYRCHHLLREVLAADVTCREPEMIGRLHDRAATWFEANGQADLAIDHAQASGDALRAARLFGQVAQVTFAAGRIDTVQRWIAWFDERGLIERNPHLAVIASLGEALLGHLATTEQWADAAAAASASAAPIAPDGSPFEYWLAHLEAVLLRRGVLQMRKDAEKARAGLNPQSPFFGPALYLEAMSYALSDDAPRADALLAQAVETNLRKKTFPTAVMATAERAVIAIDRRDWPSAERLAQDAFEIVQERHLESYLAAVVAYSVAARTAAHQGDVASAKSYTVLASRLRPLCTAAVPLSAHFLLQLVHAYLECADPAGARAVLRQVRDILQLRPDVGTVGSHADELQQMVDAVPTGSVGVSSLTAAELRLLPLLATHLSYPDIGDRLHLSRHTVKSQAASLMRKLGVSSRREAVSRAEEIGLLGH